MNKFVFIFFGVSIINLIVTSLYCWYVIKKKNDLPKHPIFIIVFFVVNLTIFCVTSWMIKNMIYFYFMAEQLNNLK